MMFILRPNPRKTWLLVICLLSGKRTRKRPLLCLSVLVKLSMYLVLQVFLNIVCSRHIMIIQLWKQRQLNLSRLFHNYNFDFSRLKKLQIFCVFLIILVSIFVECKKKTRVRLRSNVHSLDCSIIVL